MDLQGVQSFRTSTASKSGTVDQAMSACSLADDPSTSNLPEPPEEPLQSDCCGTGCSPCVFDIYQEDMERWKELASLKPEERAAGLLNRSMRTELVATEAALSRHEYRTFEIAEIERASRDSLVFTLHLPEGRVLGTELGQHAILR